MLKPEVWLTHKTICKTEQITHYVQHHDSRVHSITSTWNYPYTNKSNKKSSSIVISIKAKFKNETTSEQK